ncbi:C39 family peptidase [Imbroritus primus]|jgi:predicted double-glycine peptidase|uniref:C39 family peptidase n=1 Tax=Imbroritus primus TaxID=3058603 RepID=UPI003D161F9B
MKAWPALLVLSALAGGWPATYAASLDIPGMRGGPASVRVTSMKEARFKGTVRQQFDFSCGSAAIATLLTYQYGQPISEQTAFTAMYAAGDQEKIRREGFSLLDIKRFLETRGFAADGFELTLDKLAEARLPAIVLIKEKGYHHFVVIKGMRGERVLIGDPAFGTRAVSRTAFEAMWDNEVLFVVHNRQELARFNQPVDWSVAPRAPLEAAVHRDGLWNITIPRLGPGDF